MKEEWLFTGAIVPVDVETTAALVAEIKRLIDVVGGMALAQPEQKRPQNCGTGYCSCIECVMEPEEGDWIEVKARWGKRFVEMPNPLLGDNHIARFDFQPPQRIWVGLTDEDLKLLSAKWRIVYGAWVNDFARDIEAKLKEKQNDPSF